MKAKSEMLLYHMLWLADFAMRPSMRRVGEGFEEWAYKNGFLRQIQELERGGFLEGDSQNAGVRRVMRLTQKGVMRALGGTDPVEIWDRPWDGEWRMVLFDLPEERRGLRNSLRKELRAARFGCLQGSVWISPHSIEDRIRGMRKNSGDQSRTLLFFSGRPCDGAGDADLVNAAWDFEKIGSAYREYRHHLKQIPEAGGNERERLLQWGNIERKLWKRCMSLDPLLPRTLWPYGYPGEKAWRERLRALKSAGSLAARL